MKYLIILLFPCLIFSQDTATEFANKVFTACKENDVKKLEQFMASPAEIKTFVTGLDPSVTHERTLEIYDEYRQKVIKRFTLLQEIAAKHKFDLLTAIINKTEVDARPVELRVDDGSKEEVNLTTVKIFFRCSGEYLCFMVSDAILINGRYYLSNEAVQLHRVN